MISIAIFLLLFPWPRPYDLPCVQIRKSDDLDNTRAKSRVWQVLLAQAVAMQIISTPCNQRTGSTRSAACSVFALKRMLGALSDYSGEATSGSGWLCASWFTEA